MGHRLTTGWAFENMVRECVSEWHCALVKRVGGRWLRYLSTDAAEHEHAARAVEAGVAERQPPTNH